MRNRIKVPPSLRSRIQDAFPPMTQGLDVLILSASTGNGHVSAGKAIEAEALSRGHKALHVDVLDWAPSGFKMWYRGGYETLVKSRPALWGQLYDQADREGPVYALQNMLDRSFVTSLRRLVDGTRPNWIICTHNLPQPCIGTFRRSRPWIQMAVVVTDLYPHKLYLRGRPERYFVPSEWTGRSLAERFPIAKDVITVSGMPIDLRFGQRREKGEARAAMGLDQNRPTLLVSAGGIGAGPMSPILKGLAELNISMSVAVACGRNLEAHRLVTEIAYEAQRPDFSISPFGHLETGEMATVMAASDLILGKPGGLTTFEALASGLPFVVADPFLIPGQEEGNADFLVETGIGRRARDVEQAVRVVGTLIQAPEQLAAMSKAALSHAKPDAVQTIMETIYPASTE